MGRNKKSERILGPYANGKRWQVVLIDGSTKHSEYFQSEEKAREKIKAVRQQLKTERIVAPFIDDFEMAKKKEGLKSQTIEKYIQHLEPFRNMGLVEINHRKIERYFSDLNLAVGTRRVRLKILKQFCSFLEKKGVISFKTFFEIGRLRIAGIQNRGKRQLTLTESKQYLQACLAYPDRERGIAACICLVLGCRPSEVVRRVVRDIDGEGSLYRIPESKTPRGIRVLEIPLFLRPLLLNICAGKSPDDLLFPFTYRQLYETTHTICKIADVSVVSPHALRGTHASLAESKGQTAGAVAEQLGHGSTKIGVGHYTLPNVRESARIDLVTNQLIPQPPN